MCIVDMYITSSGSVMTSSPRSREPDLAQLLGWAKSECLWGYHCWYSS